ncbi:MFS transporter, partial [Streptomyces sp. SID8499]
MTATRRPLSAPPAAPARGRDARAPEPLPRQPAPLARRPERTRPDAPPALTPRAARRRGVELIAALLGFTVITIDVSAVNIALPAIRGSLSGGMTGLQWVVDAYTLMFAALMLSAGALADRAGARRAYAWGVALFT